MTILTISKFKPYATAKATFFARQRIPIGKPVNSTLRLTAFLNPLLFQDSTECLDELKSMLLDSQQWGLCIEESFDIARCIISAFISLSLSVLFGMVADDLGRTTGGSLRVSLMAFMWLVFVLGLISCPALTDDVRKYLTVPWSFKRREPSSVVEYGRVPKW
jgi:hypothetical protein